MGKPKVDMATAESVSDLEAKLDALASETKQRDKDIEDRCSRIEKSIADLKQELSNKIRSVEQGAENQAGTVQKIIEESKELTDFVKKEAEKIVDIQSHLQTLDQSVAGVDSLAHQNYQELEEMRAHDEEVRIQELKEAKEELEVKAMETSRKDADMVSSLAKKELDGATATVRGEMSGGLRDLEKKLHEAMQKGFAGLDQRLTDTKEALEANSRNVASGAQEKADILDKTLRKEISKVEREIRQKAEKDILDERQARSYQEAHFDAALKQMTSELKVNFLELEAQDRKTLETLQSHRREAEERTAAVLAESRASIQLLEGESSRLNAFCAGVSGLPTRQVEWRIAEETLKQLERVQDRRSLILDDETLNGDSQTSFFSPPFEAAGTRGMQLELRVHTRRQGVGDTQEQTGGGDQCSLYLWAAAGLQLVFRLFLGSESVILRHTFDGKLPCGMKRMGAIVEQKALDGSLRLGIEIHESLIETVAGGQAGTSNPMALQVVERQAPHRPVDGTLAVQRYLNHRLLELMQSQGRGMLDQLQRKVDQVRSRATRRVQWRLENAPLLRQSFGQDQPVRSTAFQAAGISGLQLVFYPSGYAGARPGFCSVFLSCPPGCTVRCWLWAGRWRREARAEPADKPDMLGRINFCRFENVVDPVDESVELALEIEEAQQVAKSGMIMNASLTNEASQSELSPSAKPGVSVLSLTENSSKDPSNGLERADLATMKVQHNPAIKPSQDGVQQLPAIWTTQSFHTFGDIQEPPADGKPRAQTANAAPKGGHQGMSPPATPVLPRPGTTSGGSRKSTPRKGNRQGAMSARDAKYREYNQASHPLPQPSY